MDTTKKIKEGCCKMGYVGAVPYLKKKNNKKRQDGKKIQIKYI